MRKFVSEVSESCRKVPKLAKCTDNEGLVGVTGGELLARACDILSLEVQREASLLIPPFREGMTYEEVLNMKVKLVQERAEEMMSKKGLRSIYFRDYIFKSKRNGKYYMIHATDIEIDLNWDGIVKIARCRGELAGVEVETCGHSFSICWDFWDDRHAIFDSIPHQKGELTENTRYLLINCCIHRLGTSNEIAF